MYRQFALCIILLCLGSCSLPRFQRYTGGITSVTITEPKNLKIPLSNHVNVVVVVDVFRAFTAAAHILEANPQTYILTSKSDTIVRLAKKYKHPLLIGKAEKGAELSYNIPNSPTRAKELNIKNNVVLHRTQAGANGVLLAKNADIILLASFVNLTATAKYIKNFPNAKIIILSMGHEGTKPSLEDDLCAWYIKRRLEGKIINLAKHIPKLKKSSGSYFFGQDQFQYPNSDFSLCLEVDRFNFAIIAKVIEDYAILSRSN